MPKKNVMPPRRRSRRIQAKQQCDGDGDGESGQVDFSEEGQLGSISQAYDEEISSERSLPPRPRRRTARRVSKPGTAISRYFAAQKPAAKPKPRKPKSSARTDGTGSATTSASVPGAESTPPSPSPFPSLALRLHGLPANRVTFFGLVQELLTPDIFGSIVVTILLNQTTGRSAIPVFYELMLRYPTPRTLAAADVQELTELLRPIGLHNRRAKRLKELGEAWCAMPPRWGVLHKSRVVLPHSESEPGSTVVTAKADGEDGGASRDGESPSLTSSQVPLPRRGKKSPRPRPTYPPTEVSHLPGVGRYALDSFLLFKPSRSHPGMASVQVGLYSQHTGRERTQAAAGEVNVNAKGVDAGTAASPQTGLEKLTSAQWLAVLERREALGERRDVGCLLPPLPRPRSPRSESLENGHAAGNVKPEEEAEDDYEHDEDAWRRVEPLDKELRAYLVWRLGRERK